MGVGTVHRDIAVQFDAKARRIERVDLSSGKSEVLYTACDGEPLRGPNDIVFDKSGGFLNQCER